MILHNFLTADSLRYQVYEDCKEIFSKSLELLYNGESDHCKAKFKDYLMARVVKGIVGSGDATPSSGDNSLRKFFKALLQKFNEDQPSLFQSSNIRDMI